MTIYRSTTAGRARNRRGLCVAGTLRSRHLSATRQQQIVQLASRLLHPARQESPGGSRGRTDMPPYRALPARQGRAKPSLHIGSHRSVCTEAVAPRIQLDGHRKVGMAEGFLLGELLNGEIFYTLRKAQVIIVRWRYEYNTFRPHSSLGYRPPAPEAVQWPWPRDENRLAGLT